MFHQAGTLIPSAEVILIGGGQCHVEVLCRYGDQKQKDYRLTLINSSPKITYAGSMSALISNEKKSMDCHIDLGHLCAKVGARFICDRVFSVDSDNNKILVSHNTRSLPYDVLSIDVGAISKNYEKILNFPENIAIPVRPVTKFLLWLETLERTLENFSREKPYRIVINGGSEYSAEFALALSRRFAKESRTFEKISISLVEAESSLENTLSPKVVAQIRNALHAANVKNFENSELQGYDKDKKEILVKGGRNIPCDSFILSQASIAPQWLRDTKLDKDESGFISTQQNMESRSHPGIYVVGDLVSTPRKISASKSGTYQKGMGKLLASNLERRFSGKIQVDFNFNKNPLTFIEIGEKKAIAIRGGLSWKSSRMKRIKSKMDKEWLDACQPKPKKILVATFIESGNLTHAPCAGAGAKLPHDILKKLNASHIRHDDVVLGIDETEDASVIKRPSSLGDCSLVQSINYLRPFSKDLNLFGRIAATHTFNDLYAMGIHPHSAHVIATVPFANKLSMDRDFSDLMVGIGECFSDGDINLAGGYSQMGMSAGIGIMAQGFSKNSENDKLWRRDKNQIDDSLILTKPLGSGILFVGHNDYIVGSQHLFSALDTMLFSHRHLLENIGDFNIRSATDVSGYGLAICLQDMMERTNHSAFLQLDQIPIYTGALNALSKGVRSSLHGQNRMPFTKSLQGLPTRDLILSEILFDPQTAGPLLISISEDQASGLVAKLQSSGFEHASIIGQVREPVSDLPRLVLSKNQRNL